MTTGPASERADRRRMVAATAVYSALLAGVTVAAQIRQVGGVHYLEYEQILRHLDVMNGTAFDPWTYRVLSDLGVDALYNAVHWLGIGKPWNVAFISFRLVQNVAIFMLAALFYRRLGLSRVATAFGLGLIAWGMMFASAHSDLKFDTWSDVIFYLVAALVVLAGDRAFPWIVPLTAVAALNRETSGLISLMLFAVAVHQGLRTARGRRTALIAAVSFAVWLVIYFGLRHIIGHRPYLLVHGHPGWELLRYNFTHREAWINLFETVSILPFVCVYAWRWWSPQLRVIGLAIAPLWVVVHFFTGVVTETRLFMVADVLVFVPGALVALSRLEPGAYTWGRALVSAGKAAVAGRALVVVGATVLGLSLFFNWYSLQRVSAPFSAAHPGPLTRASAWDHQSGAAIALACLAVSALVLALLRPRRLVAAAQVAVGVAALGLAYREIAVISGLHFYPRGFPLALGGLFHSRLGSSQPRLLPAHPANASDSVTPLAAAHAAAAAALLILCAALYRAFAERASASP